MLCVINSLLIIAQVHSVYFPDYYHYRQNFIDLVSSKVKSRSPERDCYQIPPPPAMSQLPDFDDEEQDSCPLLADTMEAPICSNIHSAKTSLKSETVSKMETCTTKSSSEIKENIDGHMLPSTSVGSNNTSSLIFSEENQFTSEVDLSVHAQASPVAVARPSSGISVDINTSTSSPSTPNKGTYFMFFLLLYNCYCQLDLYYNTS